MTPPPLRSRDEGDLRLLAVFHFVHAGLSLLILGFLAIHYVMMRIFFTNPKMWETAKEPPPFDPAEFFHLFAWLYTAGAVMTLAFMALNLLSGAFLLKRRHRLFTMITASINCLSFPLGTALGVFTLVVLCRESVERLYAEPSLTPEHEPPPPLIS